MNSLCLNFLICKTGILTSTSWSCEQMSVNKSDVSLLSLLEGLSNC